MFIPDNPIILNFLRKQGNKIILMREEKGKKDKDCPLGRNGMKYRTVGLIVLGMQSPGSIELRT